MTIPNKPKLSCLFRMQYEEVQQCHVLLYPEGMVKLNQSAGEILLLCDGTHTVEGIIAELETKFNTANLGSDVMALLEEAARRNWLESP